MASIMNQLLKRGTGASPSSPKHIAPQAHWVNSLLAGDTETTLREMTQFTAEMPTLKRRSVFMNVRSKWRKLGGDVTSETYRKLCVPDNEEGYRAALLNKVVEKNTNSRLVSKEELDSMIERAITFIRDDSVDTTHVKANVLRTVEALCLLTGRRKWEIVNTLRIRSVDGEPYQARIEGLCKSKDRGQSIVIPLLAPIDVIITGLVKVRRFEGSIKHGSYTVKSIFGKSISHTMFRDLYATAAYDRRFVENHFELDVGPAMFRANALGISLTVASSHYNTLTTDIHGGSTSVIGKPNGDEHQ